MVFFIKKIFIKKLRLKRDKNNMNLINYIEKAKKQNWALGQFNFSTMEQMKGIIAAAHKENVPVILGTSEGESRFFGLKEAVALRDVMREEYSEVYLNLDHGKDLKWVEKAINAGYDMVHFDGSDLSLEENIFKTKTVVNLAKAKSIVVEGEIGKVGGSSSIHNKAPEKQKDLTSTQTLVKFISETGIDLCAFSIGNIHGVYNQAPELDFDLLDEINKKSVVGLVMHGGSGIKDEDIRKSIKKGVVKINVNTELRKVWRDEIDRSFQANPDEVTPYKLFSKVTEEIYKKTTEKINIFYENYIR